MGLYDRDYGRSDGDGGGGWFGNGDTGPNNGPFGDGGYAQGGYRDGDFSTGYDDRSGSGGIDPRLDPNSLLGKILAIVPGRSVVVLLIIINTVLWLITMATVSNYSIRTTDFTTEDGSLPQVVQLAITSEDDGFLPRDTPIYSGSEVREQLANGAKNSEFVVIAQRSWICNWGGASGDSLRRPYLIWQTFTYAFLHSHSSVFHVLFNMFGLFIFGRMVEQSLGSAEFLRFYLVAAVLGGLIYATIQFFTGWNGYVVGASGAVCAVTLLFCLKFPNVTLRLMGVVPVQAWVVGTFLVVSNLITPLLYRSDTAFDVHLAGIGLGLAYFRWNWNFEFLNPARLFGGRPRLRLHTNDDDDANTPNAPNRREVREQAEDDQADAILEKVYREGEESLTRPERKLLERVSKRKRQERTGQ